MLTLKKYKQLIITILIIIFIPFILPIIEILFKMIITLGRYIGMNIRFIEEGICFK